MAWCVLTKCSKDTVLKRLKSHRSSNFHLLSATLPDFSQLSPWGRTTVHESAGDMDTSRAVGKMQDFTLNQLCPDNCFGKGEIKLRGPHAQQGQGPMIKWVQMDKIGGRNWEETSLLWSRGKQNMHTHIHISLVSECLGWAGNEK